MTDQKWIPIINDLEKRGILVYDITEANGCFMVCYGRVVAYYYVVDGEITEIVYD